MSFQTKRQILGQHFLKDVKLATSIAQRMIEEAQTTGCNSLLEIGPGRGALTNHLLEMAALNSIPLSVILCEKDPKLASFWKTNLAINPIVSSVKIEEADFLDFPTENWLNNLPLAVVSNLPYSAATAILTRLARHADKIPVMILMFQAEVGRKLRPNGGSSHRGSLSVWLQNWWDIEKLYSVPAKDFTPPPKVDSEVLLLKARKSPRISLVNSMEREILFEKLLKVCFMHRRKMLRSGLPESGPWKKALSASGVDETKRPEALEWEEWNLLFNALERLLVENPTPVGYP